MLRARARAGASAFLNRENGRNTDRLVKGRNENKMDYVFICGPIVYDYDEFGRMLATRMQDILVTSGYTT